MGFGDLIGPLVSLVRQKLSLTQFEASFIAFAGFIMFGTLSVPTGYFQEKFGKRVTVITGLCLMLGGLLLPLAGLSSYRLFLAAVLVIGAGATVLQVAGAPLLHAHSSPGDFARNLTFAQFIKGIGTLSAPLIPFLAIRYFHNRWEVVFTVFAAGTFCALLIFLARVRREAPDISAVAKATFSGSFVLLTDPRVWPMVLAIFLYVGAEVCMSATLPALMKDKAGNAAGDIGMAGVGLFFLTLMAGRFAGSVALRYLSARRFLLITALLSLAGIALLFIARSKLSFVAACLVGLGFANIFPLVFSLNIESRPARASELSGLMVTAIAGGALVPPVMGYVSDRAGVAVSLVVPLCCILYVLYIAVRQLRAGRAV